MKLPMSHGVKSLHRIQNAKSLQHTVCQITLQHSEMSHSTALFQITLQHSLATLHHSLSFKSLYSIQNASSHSTAPYSIHSASTLQQCARSLYSSVSQTAVRGPQVVLGFCPCGPFRLNISPKKTEKNKINVNCVSHTIVENLKQSLEITYNTRL